MKIIKILGIAVGLHALALILIFANPGCSYTDAAGTDGAPDAGSPISSAPDSASSAAQPAAQEPMLIRYSPTRPGTSVATALETQPVSDVTPASAYTVAHGDSLWSIANKNHLTKADLAAANNLKSSSVLRVGQKLIIPAKAGQVQQQAAVATTSSADKPSGDSIKHTVKAGETLGAIARKYGVRQGDIAVANNISDPRRIQPGQELIIPAKSGSGGKQVASSKAPSLPEATPAQPETKTMPSSDQDLDAGLKTPADTDVPQIRIGDGAQPKNP
jgi:LysM repeat protein